MAAIAGYFVPRMINFFLAGYIFSLKQIQD